MRQVWDLGSSPRGAVSAPRLVLHGHDDEARAPTHRNLLHTLLRNLLRNLL